MAGAIVVEQDRLVVPERPIIPFIEGDGTGPDIWAASKRVIDAAVEKSYGGTRQIAWKEVLAGEKAYAQTGEYLPSETLETLRRHIVAIKGPLGTPIGGGFRSINVTLRQKLDLYACVRPVKWIGGTPSPVLKPEDVDVVIFRENIEDVYAGVEWPADSVQARMVTAFLNDKMACHIPEEAGIGIKFISRHGAERIMRKAMRYALEHGRKRVTVVHKGNIMKYTEGAFKNWCNALAQKEFSSHLISEQEVAAAGGVIPEGKILLNDRIADNMFQQILLRSREYEVLVCPNLNGDYLSDAIAAQVGGLGMAPGCNMGDHIAIFEATHGNAPKYAGLDKVNPGSLLLSAVMMLRYIGWQEAATTIETAMEKAIRQKKVTYDLARRMPGAMELKTSAFATAVINNM